MVDETNVGAILGDELAVGKSMIISSFSSSVNLDDGTDVGRSLD